jgi:DNA-binding PadR family transcriptional regulator
LGGDRFDGGAGEWDAAPTERRRLFDNRALRLVLLHLIKEEPRHGYELIRAIESLSRGAYAPSPGVVYPTLTALQEIGEVSEPEVENQRKLFSITRLGRSHLAENAGELSAVLERLRAMGQVRDRADAAPIRRAMQSLKSAFIDKLESGADRETVLQIAAAIDEAAQKIERL